MICYAWCSIAVCVITALMIVLGGDGMNTTAWISLVVAIIGVLGAILTAVLQLKRDGKSIDRIDAATAEIKPSVQSIQKTTEKTQDILRDSIKPSLTAIQQRTDRIDYIADGFKEFKRLEAYYSGGLVNREILLGQIGAVFTENTRLNEKCKELEREKQVLVDENRALKNKNQRLQQQLNVRQAEREEYPTEWEL